MYVQVKLLNGYHQYLWYKVPDAWSEYPCKGSIVQVPLKKQIIPAVIMQESMKRPIVSFTIKELHAIEQMPQDAHYYPFLEQLCSYYQIDQLHILQRIKHVIHQAAIVSSGVATAQENAVVNVCRLTDEQQQVVDFLTPRIIYPVYTPTVLHGVTGSGKTEVYKELIRASLSVGKSIILLLPEVTLAINFERRLAKELPDVPLFSFHSGTTSKEKRQVWKYLLQETPIVLIGVHLPILLPIAQLGCIIIDEEHEVGYQEKKFPRINSKEAALMRAQQYGIPILLGSATPSVSTLYNVTKRGWFFFQLKKRFKGSFAQVKSVPLTDGKQRKSFWISNELYAALKDRLLKKEQSIIFINRRGFSFFVQCKDCSYVYRCSDCSVSLTLHEGSVMKCHYCGSIQNEPVACNECNAQHLIKKGIGTQQVVTILQRLFPAARVARADLDTSARKKEWEKTIDAFARQEIDILVGTQTITKGYHFPHVTLVGVIWADLNLHFPVYNASEIALQQLIQVAGRAGREQDNGLVIIQYMKEHDIFSYINEIDYPNFFSAEIESRSQAGYPPCKRLAYIECKYEIEEILVRESQSIVDLLRSYCNIHAIAIDILGPAQPPVYRVQKMHALRIYCKSIDMAAIIRLYRMIDHTAYKSSIQFIPNPIAS